MGAQAARPSVVGAPVGHAIGMQSGLVLPILRPVGIHLIDVWNPTVVLQALVECNATSGSGSTFFLQSLIEDPTCTPAHHALIESVGMGGAPVPALFADRVEGLGISLMRSYGSTEHPSTTGGTQEDPRAKRNHTDGRPLAGVELRLMDADGKLVERGEPGEIYSRGPDLCLGYTDPALTADAFDAQGWYRSGDVGVEDEDGYITITDRVKDIIIRGGENVSAAEIEELLLGLPGVAEVAVVAAPDARMGEHACAFFRLVPGTDEINLDAMRSHLEAEGLGRQKWPEELRFVEDFPRTPTGKVKKFELRSGLRAEAGV
jgi:acyl-CoA synthetase